MFCPLPLFTLLSNLKGLSKTVFITAVKGCQGIVFAHGVQMGGRAGVWASGKSLSGLYLRNRKM